MRGQTPPRNRATLPARSLSPGHQPGENLTQVLATLWERTSAIADDCTRLNHILKEKEREASELAGIIRDLSAECSGSGIPHPGHPGLTMLHPSSAHASLEAQGRIRQGHAHHPHESHEPHQDIPLGLCRTPLGHSGPVESTDESYLIQMPPRASTPEAADTDVYDATSPARTQPDSAFAEESSLDSAPASMPEQPVEEADLELETEVIEESEVAGIGTQSVEVIPTPVASPKALGTPGFQVQEPWEQEPEEGELFSKVRAALSRVVGGDAADALHGPSMLPPCEECARPPPEPATRPTTQEASPFTESNSTASAWVLATDLEEEVVTPDLHIQKMPLDQVHTVVEDAPHESEQTASLDSRESSMALQDPLPSDSTAQPLHYTGLSWESLALPLAEAPVLEVAEIQPASGADSSGATTGAGNNPGATLLTTPALPPEAVGRVPVRKPRIPSNFSFTSSKSQPYDKRASPKAAGGVPFRKKSSGAAGTPQAQASAFSSSKHQITTTGSTRDLPGQSNARIPALRAKRDVPGPSNASGRSRREAASPPKSRSQSPLPTSSDASLSQKQLRSYLRSLARPRTPSPTPQARPKSTPKAKPHR